MRNPCALYLICREKIIDALLMTSLPRWTHGVKIPNKLAFLLDETLLEQLVKAGNLLPEAKINKVRRLQAIAAKKDVIDNKIPFRIVSVHGTPSPGRTYSPAPSISAEEQTFDEIDIDIATQQFVPPKHRRLLMTLQKTDVGIGQTHPRTSRRSPEVFIPLAARDHDPDFWGWPDKFVEDPTRDGKFDRVGVLLSYDYLI